MTTKDKNKLKDILIDLGLDPKTPVDDLWKNSGDMMEKAMLLWTRWKCLTDLYFLGSEVLGMKEARRKRPGGKWFYLLDDKFHGWMCNALSSKGDKMIIVPRGHLKSAWVKVKIVQDILKDPNIRIGFYSVTTGLVQNQLVSIKRLFQHPNLQKLFPAQVPLPGKKEQAWGRATADVLTVWREKGSQVQENQIEVYGAESTVVGKHFDVHYYDDLIDDDVVRTAERLAKVREWYGYVQAILEPGGQEIMTGTPYHYSDLYSSIENDGIYDNVFRRPAVENGKPVYNYFTLKMLERLKKRMGSYLFSCQYMVNPTPDEDKIFPAPQPTFVTLPKGEYAYYMTVDPAGTVGTHSDETAITIAAVDKIARVYILESFGMKKKGDDIARILLEKNEKYNFARIGIEFGVMANLQVIIDMVKKQWERAQNKEVKLPIESIKLKSIKGSKFERINLTLGSMLRQGKVKIYHSLTKLMDQMEMLTPNYEGKDDLVDSAAMIFQLPGSISFRHWSDPIFGQPDAFTVENLFKKEPKNTYTDKFAV